MIRSCICSIPKYNKRLSYLHLAALKTIIQINELVISQQHALQECSGSVVSADNSKMSFVQLQVPTLSESFSIRLPKMDQAQLSTLAIRV
jgi:hypothetical protein